MYQYAARCERVVDGDTVHLSIDLGLSVHVHETCRLLGINAPEMHGETRAAGELAKLYLSSLIEGVELIVDTIKDAKCKYGRYLVVIRVGETNVNEAMVAAGMAVLYDGS
jgi:micrococcal nuclease